MPRLSPDAPNALPGDGALADAATPNGRGALHPDRLHALGLLAYQAGNYRAAVDIISLAIRFRDNVAAYHCDLGLVLQCQGHVAEAAAQYRRALALDPRHAATHTNLARLLQAQGQQTAAVFHFKRALEYRPNDALIHNNLGIALLEQGRSAEAESQFRNAMALDPDHADTHHNLGNSLLAQRQIADAVTCFRQAIALRPAYGGAHASLGRAFRIQGQLDAARRAYETAVALEPTNCHLYRPLFQLRQVKEGDAYLAAVENLITQASLSDADRTELQFALGKAYADLGEGERSFHHFRAGNVTRRQQIAYDETRVLAEFGRVATIFTRDLIDSQHCRGEQSAVPIFIVGMPRSGTTLAEQILASHPQVVSGGELHALGDTLAGFGQSPPLPEGMQGPPRDEWRELGQRYLAAVRPIAPQAARIVDKMPGNFVFCGGIHLALPNARIIHLRRDPVDTCLSCFTTLFSAGHPYSYDLRELGRYYRAYQTLMEHWRAVLPRGAILDVDYEEIVSHPEQQARRMVAHCNLPWHDACVDFHKTARPVWTASAVQVRQPIFHGSVGRWRLYGDLLRPLIEALGQDNGSVTRSKVDIAACPASF